MGIFKIFKSKNNTKNSEDKLDILKGLISLCLDENDRSKILNFLEELSKSEKFENSDEIFDSQDMIDFMYDEKICFYGFFDWKDESAEFDDYIREALKKNFSLEWNDNICDLDELGSIDLVYKLYGSELEKKGITLCSVDTLSDSYIIMLVKNDDYIKFKKYADRFIEFKGKHYTEEW